MKFKCFSFVIIFVLLSSQDLFGLRRNDTSSVKTILKQTTPRTPIQIMQETADSQNRNNESELPRSEEIYSPEQDSTFYKIVNMHLPVNVILMNNLRFTDDIYTFEKKMAEGTPWQIALQNIRNIPPEFYNPSPVEMVHREIMKMSAFEVPFVRTYDPFMPRFDVNEILSFFGLVEDVSPKIQYSIDYSTNVEVVVYSISSAVVATLFKGLQPPGNYTLTWNGRNQEGRLMPPGDYIAEVRIGNDKYTRKRIVIR